MVWNIGDPGNQSLWSLGSWVKGTVMLGLLLLRCLHLDLQFWRDWRSLQSVSLISEFLRLRGLLRLGHVWALFGYQCVLW